MQLSKTFLICISVQAQFYITISIEQIHKPHKIPNKMSSFTSLNLRCPASKTFITTKYLVKSCRKKTLFVKNPALTSVFNFTVFLYCLHNDITKPWKETETPFNTRNLGTAFANQKVDWQQYAFMTYEKRVQIRRERTHSHLNQMLACYWNDFEPQSLWFEFVV